MAFEDDVTDWVTSQVTHIGLSTDGSTEYSGGAYTDLAPSYAASASGTADITATLEFDGTANDGPVTHFILKRTAELWRFVPVDTSQSFNSDGRLDLTSAPVTSTTS